MQTDQGNHVKLGDAATQKADAQIWDRFTEIVTERYIYSPEENGESPLVGYLLNVLDMPPMDMGEDGMRPWKCFLVKITEPAMVLDREKQPILVKKGSEVLIPATYQIFQHLQQPALDPQRCWEVYIQPQKRHPLGGVKKLWLFQLGWNQKNPLPRASFGFPAKLGAPVLAAANAPALTEGTASAAEVMAAKTIDVEGVPVEAARAGASALAEKTPF